ncbi:hypothetical protein J8L85_15435 [Maribacter sp. MMG018]|uniref:hypothetical protein n=1 Tax=Maribacter sp. MMG018 TaxID=2822688 RepID=UPI001B373BAF|nr:hypothetical protein [Maribacter sp. MMG018]MBQ4915847.1 hypothetical protein [Maribacter sp. MMG018]
MSKNIAILILTDLTVLNVTGQELDFSPDMVLGNRSVTYKHFIGYSINSRLSIDQLTLFDTEYEEDANNIYFIRNNFSYHFNEKIKLNTAIGIKNPGAFCTVSLGFSMKTNNFSFTYTAGSTYQKGFSFEQSVVFSYTPDLGHGLEGYINLLATANINGDGYIRGLQQFKIGIRKKQMITGLALNLDQFNNAQKKLENMGVFVKYNF